MTRTEYFKQYSALMAKGYNDNDPEVTRLNSQYSRVLDLANVANPSVDVSNQGQANRSTPVVSGEGFSHSQIQELRWVQGKMQQEAGLESLAEGVAALKAENSDYYTADGSPK